MKTIEEFLAYAVRLEREAALRFDELADAIQGQGVKELVDFFRQMATYSRRHLQEAEARSGFREKAQIKATDYVWPEGESPEAAVIWAADGFSTVDDAMALALEAEERGQAFYANVASAATDPEIKAMAQEFADEEAGHVEMLKVLMIRYKAA